MIQSGKQHRSEPRGSKEIGCRMQNSLLTNESLIVWCRAVPFMASPSPKDALSPEVKRNGKLISENGSKYTKHSNAQDHGFGALSLDVGLKITQITEGSRNHDSDPRRIVTKNIKNYANIHS